MFSDLFSCEPEPFDADLSKCLGFLMLLVGFGRFLPSKIIFLLQKNYMISLLRGQAAAWVQASAGTCVNSLDDFLCHFDCIFDHPDQAGCARDSLFFYLAGNTVSHGLFSLFTPQESGLRTLQRWWCMLLNWTITSHSIAATLRTVLPPARCALKGSPDISSLSGFLHPLSISECHRSNISLGFVVGLQSTPCILCPSRHSCLWHRQGNSLSPGTLRHSSRPGCGVPSLRPLDFLSLSNDQT